MIHSSSKICFYIILFLIIISNNIKAEQKSPYSVTISESACALWKTGILSEIPDEKQISEPITRIEFVSILDRYFTVLAAYYPGIAPKIYIDNFSKDCTLFDAQECGPDKSSVCRLVHFGIIGVWDYTFHPNLFFTYGVSAIFIDRAMDFLDKWNFQIVIDNTHSPWNHDECKDFKLKSSETTEENQMKTSTPNLLTRENAYRVFFRIDVWMKEKHGVSIMNSEFKREPTN